MKCKPVQPEEALQQGKRLPYLLYYTYSQAYLGPVPQELPDMSQVLRLSFFGPREEIRLFRQNGETLCGISMEEEEGDCPVRETFVIANPQFGGSITVANYLTADEDGQSSFYASRLTDWEGSEHRA